MKFSIIIILISLACSSSSSCMERRHGVQSGGIGYPCDENKELFTKKAREFLKEAFVHFFRNNSDTTIDVCKKNIIQYLMEQKLELSDEELLLEICPSFSWETLYKQIVNMLGSMKVEEVAKEKNTTHLDILFFKYVYSILEIQRPSNFNNMTKANQNEYSKKALFSISKKLAKTILSMLENGDYSRFCKFWKIVFN